MGKKWITFDLDGTLMKNPFGEWVFPEIDRIAGKYHTSGKRIFDELVLEHRMRMKAGLLVEAYDWDAIVGVVLEQNGIPFQINVEELVKKHSVFPKVYLLEDGLIEVLHGLKEKGFSLAVVTNGFLKYQKPVMDVLGLTKVFDIVITPEKAGYGKPRMEMVNGLLHDGDEIVAHVGDRLDHDVVFSNKLGVMSVLIYHNMPELMKNARPTKRSETKEGMELLREKWIKETEEKLLPGNAFPKIIIQSIKEMGNLIL